MRELALLLTLLWSSSAWSAGSPVTINDESGCNQGNVTTVAPVFCDDFAVAKMSSRDKLVAAAKAKCTVFYQDALRLQNVFCSYQKDAVKFQVTSLATAQANIVGEANVSERVVSHDNFTAATIGRAYMAKISALSAQFKAHYQDYIVSLGKLNAAAGADEQFEATCQASEVRSEVPGHLRTMLATFTWAAARVSYNSMASAVRTNYGQLRAMKEQAEQNAHLAQMRAIEVGQVLNDVVTQQGPSDDSIQLPPSTAGNSGVQYFSTKLIEKTGSRLAAGAGILGAGTLLVYQTVTGQQIKYFDTAAMFIMVFQPEIGLAAGMLVATGRRSQEVLEIYQKFSQDQLSVNHGSNAGITAMELMKIWGQRTKQPACVSSAATEIECIEKRKTMGPYDHGPCASGVALPSSSSTITGP